MKFHPNVGIIGDRHAPFTHPRYLDFCQRTFDRYDCETIVDIGDGADQHALSFHGADPSGASPGPEMKLALRELNRWYRAFPKVKSCIGNHDARIARRAYNGGIPAEFLKPLREVYEAPTGWVFDFSFVIDDVMYKHGSGSSGHNAAFRLAQQERRSVVRRPRTHGGRGPLPRLREGSAVRDERRLRHRPPVVRLRLRG